MLARDPRVLEPGHAQYAIWCDDRGFIVEDGVLLRHGKDDFMLTAAEPNFAYFADLIGRGDDVRIEEVSEQWAVLSLQGPRSRRLLASLDGAIDRLAYFEHTKAKIAGRKVTVSRTGFTGDLGYEVWAKADDALAVWDAVWEACRGNGVLPFGLQALYMTRIEAGLLLLDVDFHNSRFAWTDADRATPHELGLGWMLRGIADDDRRFIGRDAIRRELADGTSRFRTTGLVVDWKRLGPRPRRGRPHPAQGPHPRPGGDVRVRRRRGAGRVRDELHVLAGPPAAHRDRAGARSPPRHRARGSTSRSP